MFEEVEQEMKYMSLKNDKVYVKFEYEFKNLFIFTNIIVRKW